MKVVLSVLILLAAARAAQGQTSTVGLPTLRTGQPSAIAPFQGGVPTGEVRVEPLGLSMADAISRALEHNVGLLTTEDGVDRAKGAWGHVRAGLWPEVSGSVVESRQKINLDAYGFPRPPGVPAVVGPFNTFDARLSLSTVLDFQSHDKLRAETHNLTAARYSVKTAREIVISVAGNTYVLALAAASRVEAVNAQVATAQALLAQVIDMKQAGLVAGIDVLRAEVQLATERQRATAARNESEKVKLQLAHIIGLPLGQPFTLIDPFPVATAPDVSFDQALERAFRTRPDYLAALERVAAAEAARKAVSDEQLPSVRVDANYGAIGLTIADARSTFAAVGGVSVPIFNAGRTSARLLQADAELRSRRTEADNLKAGIYYDLRAAYLDVDASSEQLRVASRARDLAAQQLEQARDRFAAGVASNIDVVQAQEAVAASSEQYITALYNYDVAKGLIILNMGGVDDSIYRSSGPRVH